MATENKLLDAAASERGGASSIEMVGMPDWRWVPLWAVLTTLAIPAALLLMAPISVILMSVSNLGF